MMEKHISEITKSGMKKMKCIKKFNIYYALPQPNQTSQDRHKTKEKKCYNVKEKEVSFLFRKKRKI